jgi:phage N-6-adenine-methyltransferase
MMESHEYATLLPMLADAELAALAESIGAVGLRHPIITFEGKILDGRNRFRACEMAHVKPMFVPFLGGHVEALQLVVDENLHRRQLTSEQRAAFWELRRRTEAKIAAAVDKVRQAAKAKLSEAGKLGGKTGGRGRPNRPVEKVPQAYPPDERKSRAAEAKLAGTNTVYLGKAKKLDDEQLKRVVAGDRGLASAHVGNNSGQNEWYTPEEYIEPSRAVLGTIDLDPASSEEANGVIRATRFYSEADNGLERPWAGRVWMNPPYSHPLVGLFCDRLAEEREHGTVEAAIVLVNNATETAWFQRLAAVSSAICFPRGRVRFWSPRGTSAAPLQGQAIL